MSRVTIYRLYILFPVLNQSIISWASFVAQLVKSLPAMQETKVWFLGWEDPLQKEMATHSSVLAWRIPQTEEPGRLQSVGSQELDTTERLSTHTHCFMSGFNCCFLTCTQISQEAGQVVWYSHLFKKFPQFLAIHTVKGFSIVNKAEVNVFWNSLAFSMIQRMLAIWSLVPLPFLNPVWTSRSSQFTCC